MKYSYSRGSDVIVLSHPHLTPFSVLQPVSPSTHTPSPPIHWIFSFMACSRILLQLLALPPKQRVHKISYYLEPAAGKITRTRTLIFRPLSAVTNFTKQKSPIEWSMESMYHKQHTDTRVWNMLKQDAAIVNVSFRWRSKTVRFSTAVKSPTAEL
jgi:hypothetical protein